MADQNLPGFPTLTSPGGTPKITSIFDFSAEALGQLRLWLEQNPPAIGISNILGFSQFTAQTSFIPASETTTSSTYGNLATVGPEITGLGGGKYLVLWGCGAAGNPAVSNAQMIVKSGAGASTDHSGVAFTSVSSSLSVSAADTITLPAGNNSLIAKYSSSDNVSTATFIDRWLIALRYANS